MKPSEPITIQPRGALEIWRPLGPAFDGLGATAMLNLGEVVFEQGRWKEAEQLFEQALPLNRRAFGPSHLRTVTNLNSLGNISLATGDSQKAEDCYAEALLVERQLYPNDIQLARTLTGLAAVRMQSGRLDEALPLADEALALVLRTDGENTPAAAVEYGNVAMVHRLAGRPARAIPLLRKARAIDARVDPADSLRMASLLSEEALALTDDEQFAPAESDLKSAMRLLARCRECDLQVAIAESAFGYLRLRQKDYPKADRFLTEALAIEERSGSLSAYQISGTLKMLSQARAKERRHGEAAELERRAAVSRTIH